MPATKVRVFPGKAARVKMRPGARTLGISAKDSPRIIRLIRAGFSFALLVRFQKATELPWKMVARFVSIQPSTMARRKQVGRLQPDESDRVWRASEIFDMAVDLFEGDTAAARRWLQTPQPGLGGEVPLELASTGAGAREVENLIGRLEYGVIA